MSATLKLGRPLIELRCHSSDRQKPAIVKRLSRSFEGLSVARSQIDSMVDLVEEAEERARKPWYQRPLSS